MNGQSRAYAGAGADIEAILEFRARTYARPLEAHVDAGTVEMLRFFAGDESYVIATTYVQRILPIVRLTRLPQAPVYFAGLAAYRGDLFAVVDVLRLYGAAFTEGATHLIVLGRAQPDIALLASGIDGIVELAADAPDALDGAALLDDPRLVVGARPGTPTTMEESQG